MFGVGGAAHRLQLCGSHAVDGSNWGRVAVIVLHCACMYWLSSKAFGSGRQKKLRMRNGGRVQYTTPGLPFMPQCPKVNLSPSHRRGQHNTLSHTAYNAQAGLQLPLEAGHLQPQLGILPLQPLQRLILRLSSTAFVRRAKPGSDRASLDANLRHPAGLDDHEVSRVCRVPWKCLVLCLVDLSDLFGHTLPSKPPHIPEEATELLRPTAQLVDTNVRTGVARGKVGPWQNEIQPILFTSGLLPQSSATAHCTSPHASRNIRTASGAVPARVADRSNVLLDYCVSFLRHIAARHEALVEIPLG